jgi:hypothetical protein
MARAPPRNFVNGKYTDPRGTYSDVVDRSTGAAPEPGTEPHRVPLFRDTWPVATVAHDHEGKVSYTHTFLT